MAELALDASQPAPLRGIPVPRGSRVVFDDEGEAVPVEHKVLLRGVPAPCGKHTRFDDAAKYGSSV